MPKLPPKNCTGCAACRNGCPTNCIAMEPREKGFLYPQVDPEQCVECGRCEAICPVLHSPKLPKDPQTPACYAAWSKDPDIRFHSTSGGVFSHLAQAILSQGGCVVGARYRPDHLVEHTIITSPQEIALLRQSKYVQSEIGLVYRQIEAGLNAKKPVLFTGTPCQCAGLRSFLGVEYENLFLCDFICRGVNSPQVYQAYLRQLEKEYASPVQQVWFKNKTFGWNNFATKVIFESGQEYLAARETDPYMLGYLKSHLSQDMRPSCYNCQFKGIRRPVDITLGDFWGVEKQFPDIDTHNGVSCVIVQSKKGDKLFRSLSQTLIFQSADLKLALRCNRCAVESVIGDG